MNDHARLFVAFMNELQRMSPTSAERAGVDGISARQLRRYSIEKPPKRLNPDTLVAMAKFLSERGNHEFDRFIPVGSGRAADDHDSGTSWLPELLRAVINSGADDRWRAVLVAELNAAGRTQAAMWEARAADKRAEALREAEMSGRVRDEAAWKTSESRVPLAPVVPSEPPSADEARRRA